jgi:hypothetical protein
MRSLHGHPYLVHSFLFSFPKRHWFVQRMHFNFLIVFSLLLAPFLFAARGPAAAQPAGSSSSYRIELSINRKSIQLTRGCQSQRRSTPSPCRTARGQFFQQPQVTKQQPDRQKTVSHGGPSTDR